MSRRMTVVRNIARKGAARNLYEALLGGQQRLGIDDQDVVAVLDGDDWLAGEEAPLPCRSCPPV